MLLMSRGDSLKLAELSCKPGSTLLFCLLPIPALRKKHYFPAPQKNSLGDGFLGFFVRRRILRSSSGPARCVMAAHITMPSYTYAQL